MLFGASAARGEQAPRESDSPYDEEPVVARDPAPVPPLVAPTQAQRELYDRARSAFDAAEFETAAALLRSALELGALNILELSLGRALFRAGRCAEAEAAYARALEAPAVATPSRDDVRARVASYRADLATCPAPTPPPSAPAPPAPAVGPAPREATPAPPEAPAGPNATTVLGWAALGTGAALLTAAIIIDAGVLGTTIDDFHASRLSGDGEALALSERIDTLQVVALVGYVGGAALASTGAALLLLTPPEASARSATLLPAPAGMALRVRW
jgi:tetratricopeptide (TPR) repeat protein